MPSTETPPPSPPALGASAGSWLTLSPPAPPASSPPRPLSPEPAPVGTWSGPAQHPYPRPFQALVDGARRRKGGRRWDRMLRAETLQSFLQQVLPAHHPVPAPGPAAGEGTGSRGQRGVGGEDARPSSAQAPGRGFRGGCWAGGQSGEGGGPACGMGTGRGRPALTPFGGAVTLTHQQQPGSAGSPSACPPGASAAPHSPQPPPRWAPPR